MRYEVTYQLAGEQHTDQIDAPDAASAAAAARQAHGGSSDMFELILVHLVEQETEPVGDERAHSLATS